jgi:predicted nucleic acid-binding protein
MSSERKHKLEYLVDTSVLVNIRDVHNDSAEIWLNVTNAIVGNRIKTVRQVWGELESRFADIATRLKAHKKQFVLPDDVTYAVRVIAEIRHLNRFHRSLWNPVGGRNPADPILIAVAKDLNIIVVTDEKRQGPGFQRRIPYVCAQRNVGSTDRLDFLRKIGCNV